MAKIIQYYYSTFVTHKNKNIYNENCYPEHFLTKFKYYMALTNTFYEDKILPSEHKLVSLSSRGPKAINNISRTAPRH